MGLDSQRNDAPVTPYSERPQWARAGFAVTGIMLALLLITLSQTVLSVALPRLVRDLGDLSSAGWLLTTHLLAVLAGLVVAGRLSDISGRRPYLLGGLAAFVIASGLCGVSTNMPLLIAGRSLEGLAAGILMPVCFAGASDIVSPRWRPRVQGLLGAVWGGATILGPGVGAIVVDTLDWRWLFYLNVPLGLIALVMLLWFPPGAPGRTVPTDEADVRWREPSTPGASQDDPVSSGLPLGRAVALMLTANALLGGITAGSLLASSITLQASLGASALGIGAALAPMARTLMAASVITGFIASQTRHRRSIVLVAFGLQALGLASLNLSQGQNDVLALLSGLLVVGVGIGVASPVLMIVGQEMLPGGMSGTASSVVLLGRLAGSVVVGTLAGAAIADPESRTAALRELYLAGALTALLGLLLAWLLPARASAPRASRARPE
jgi:MFS family permease